MRALIERKRVGGIRLSISPLVGVILRDLTGVEYRLATCGVG